MTGRAERTAAIRAGAGLFRSDDRGVLEVGGSERARWLDGMVSNDVASLESGGVCRALLLTRQGRITADLRVLSLSDVFWLELPRVSVEPVQERLDGFIIADDVTLLDRSPELERWSLEGPAAGAIFEAAAEQPAPRIGETQTARIAGAELRAAGFGLSGLPGVQLFVPAGRGEEVALTLRTAGEGRGLVDADLEARECLRVEMGEPLMGRELDESVLPAEARLEEAISETKGCYTGQEVVARMRSRGRANHLLVGLRFAGALPERGSELAHEGRRVGEVTSAVLSPSEGPIGLAFVKAELTAPGTRLQVAGEEARVAPLPFAP